MFDYVCVSSFESSVVSRTRTVLPVFIPGKRYGFSVHVPKIKPPIVDYTLVESPGPVQTRLQFHFGFYFLFP